MQGQAAGQRGRYRVGLPSARALLALLCLATLASTAVYITNVRRRFDNAAPAPYHALEGELWRWRGSADAQRGASFIFAGVSSSVVEEETVRLSGSNHASVSNTSRRRSALGQQPHFHWREVFCGWRRSGSGAAPADEHRVDGGAEELLIFFLHGNAGGAWQGNVWGCTVDLYARLAARTVRSFTFDFAEQANIHRGRLLERQADFVADAVETEVARQPPRRRTVWLVGHSMGGVVARVAAALVHAGGAAEVEGILTFNTPHRYPPLLLDRPLRDLYVSLQQTSGSAASVGERRDGLWDSRAFVVACGGGDDSADGCRPFRPASFLLSVTSGEMDLQIEPATTFPVCDTVTAATTNTLSHPAPPLCLFANLQASAACGRSASHDGAIRDACMLALAATALTNLTGCRSGALCGERVSPALHVVTGDLSIGWAGVEARVALPGVPLLGWLGRRLWTAHLWPLAAAALFIWLLLLPLGTPPTKAAVGPAESTGLDGALPAMMHRPTRRHAAWMASVLRGRRLLRAASASPTAATVALMALAQSALFAAVLVGSVVGDGLWPLGWTARAAPWVWDRWRPHFPSSMAQSPPAGTRQTSISPSAVLLHGSQVLALSSTTVAVGVGAANGLAAVVATALSLVASVLGRGPRRVAGWVPSAFVAVLYVGLPHCSVSLSWRAVVWLLLSLLVPFCGAGVARRSGGGEREEADSGDGGAVKARTEPEAAADEGAVSTTRPPVVFALLHLLHLQPVFAVRNEIFSDTTDEAGTVDRLVFVTEACAVLQLMPVLVGWRMTPGAAAALARQKTHGRMASAAIMIAHGLARAANALGCAALAISPVEMCHLSVALLLAFPSFVLPRLLASPSV